MQPNEKWPTVQLETASTRAFGPIKVDCSDWEAEIPDSDWATVDLEDVNVHLPPIEGEFVPAPFTLIITFTIDAGYRAEQLVLHSARLMSEILAANPDLGLNYDWKHSQAQNGIVRIALISAKEPNSEQRLQAIAQSIQNANGNFGGLIVKTAQVEKAN